MAYKIDSTYKFNDMLSNAKLNRRTVTEELVMREKFIEDPRAVGFLDEQVGNLYKARKAFHDGVEQKFATNGFVAIDANIRRPLFNAYATRHMPMITGGGALEIDKGFIMNMATTAGRLASGSNNKVNLVKANVESIQVPIVPIQFGLFIGQVDLMKADHIGYDQIGVEGEAVRYSYQIELDKFAFIGDKETINGVTTQTNRGLLNQDIVPTNATKALEQASTGELVKMFGDILVKQAGDVLYEVDKTINKILIWPSLLTKLAMPAYIADDTGTVFKSHYEFLVSALRAIKDGLGGGDLVIEAIPYVSPTADAFNFDPLLRENGIGEGRVVFYRQDANVMRLRLAMDLTGGALVYDVVNNGMRRNYIAFIGYPLVFYPTIAYLDNIAETAPIGG